MNKIMKTFKKYGWMVVLSSVLVGMLSGCATSHAVDFPESENLRDVYNDVIGTRDQLYVKANDWMVRQFNSAESVVQFQDKQEGAIIGKYLVGGSIAYLGYGMSADRRIFAIIDIRVKDNAAKIEIKPQQKWSYVTTGFENEKNPALSKQYVLMQMKEMSKSFHAALLKADDQF